VKVFHHCFGHKLLWYVLYGTLEYHTTLLVKEKGTFKIHVVVYQMTDRLTKKF
jgi:GMP synthase-like glutamine amidotransferase